MKKTFIGILALVVTMGLWPVSNTHAQSSPDSSRIEFRLKAVNFFYDNEYFGRHAAGYTLPGFYLRPHLVWRLPSPHSTLSTLEVGVHWLHFWGATNYPAATAYDVWPLQGDSTTFAHLLPWMRADVRWNDHVRLILGSLHYNDGHRLPLPLYNPERRFAADPEAGVQLQLNYRHLDADIWVDWNQFIWQHSPQQERFTAGLSVQGRIPMGDHTAILIPMAFVGQHLGGQGLSQSRPVQNKFNASAGLAVSHTLGVWTTQIECHLMGFTQKNVSVLPFQKGWGIYPSLHILYDNSAMLDIAFWQGHGFLPLLGSSLFSNIATVGHDTSIFHRTRLITVGASYKWHNFKHCNVLLTSRYYNYLVQDNTSQYSIGIRIDLHPTLTLLQ